MTETARVFRFPSALRVDSVWLAISVHFYCQSRSSSNLFQSIISRSRLVWLHHVHKIRKTSSCWTKTKVTFPWECAIEVVAIFQGHQVNVRDYSGWLPIHEAANHGYVEIVEHLIDKGAKINDRGGDSCEGITPLHDAANNGKIDVVRLLVRRGANVHAKDVHVSTTKLYYSRTSVLRPLQWAVASQ